MPERICSLAIEGDVFPDVVTVTAPGGQRDYVTKDLHESILAANDAWQAENERLREQVRSIYAALERAAFNLRNLIGRHVTMDAADATDADLLEIRRQMVDIGIEV